MAEDDQRNNEPTEAKARHEEHLETRSPTEVLFRIVTEHCSVQAAGTVPDLRLSAVLDGAVLRPTKTRSFAGAKDDYEPTALAGVRHQG